MINFSNIFITSPKTFNLSLGVAGKEILTLSALYRSCQFLPLISARTICRMYSRTSLVLKHPLREPRSQAFHYFVETNGGALLRAWYFYKNNRVSECSAGLCQKASIHRTWIGATQCWVPTDPDLETWTHHSSIFLFVFTLTCVWPRDKKLIFLAYV